MTFKVIRNQVSAQPPGARPAGFRHQAILGPVRRQHTVTDDDDLLARELYSKVYFKLAESLDSDEYAELGRGFYRLPVSTRDCAEPVAPSATQYLRARPVFCEK